MIVCFDAYGTLFDVDGAARAAAADDPALAQVWPRLSADWRRKQLEYSWLRAITGRHADFWTVTREALDWAAEAHGAQAARERLLDLYRRLPAYDDAAPALARLRDGGARLAVFSNGTTAMLEEAATAAGLRGCFEALLSVEAAGIYKPAPAAYRVMTDHFACAPEAITFVSANGWDVDGAGAFGCRTVWLNRAGAPVDRLPNPPGRIIASLSELEPRP